MNYSVEYNYQQEYLFECDWYNDFDDKEEHAYGIVFADTLEIAVIKINKRLPNCYNLNIKEYQECDFVWLNKYNYEKLLNDDYEYMFDEPDSETKLESMIDGQN